MRKVTLATANASLREGGLCKKCAAVLFARLGLGLGVGLGFAGLEQTLPLTLTLTLGLRSYSHRHVRLRLFRAVSGLVPGDPLCSLAAAEFQAP